MIKAVAYNSKRIRITVVHVDQVRKDLFVMARWRCWQVVVYILLAHTSVMSQTEGPGTNQLSQMTVPTLFIVGEEDEIAPPHVIEAASRTISGATVTKVPEAGHSVYFEKPDIFNFEVLRFLQGAAATAGSPSTARAEPARVG